MRHFLLSLCLFAFFPFQAASQSTTLTLSTSGAAAHDGEMPFWLVANRFGTVDRKPAQAALRMALTRSSAMGPNKRIRYSYGFDVLGRRSEHNTVHLHQLFGTLSWGPFSLSAGKREGSHGVRDTTLTSGSLVFGSNAAPVPGVQIELENYWIIPGTDDFLAVKGHWGQRWLEKSRFVSNAQLHEKSFYLRMLPDRFPVQGFAGIIHGVMWAGTHPRFGKLPSSFSDYLRIFFVQEGNEEAPQNEIVNVLGNTVGAYDFSIKVKTKPLDLLIYRQFYIETGPSLRFRNPLDGQWGISLRSKKSGLVDGVLWEHVNMLRQGAKYSEGEENGVDNYYNNVLYQGGWTYRGRSLGLPLLFTDGVRTGIVNNMVLAHHFGVQGNLTPSLRYRALATFSRNYGASLVFEAPGSARVIPGFTPRRDHTALLLELNWNLPYNPAWHLQAAGAIDAGSLRGRNVGVLVGVSWIPEISW